MARLGKIAVGVAVVFWSFGNLVVRDSPLSGPELAFWRYAIAAVLYVVAHRLLIGPIRWSDFKRALPTGIAISLEIAAFFMAIQRTSVANTTVIGALMPLLLFGVASRRFAERVSINVIVLAGLAVAGVAAVLFGSGDGASLSLSGDLLAVVALVLFAAYFAFGKAAREHLSSFTLQTHTMLIGVPVLAGLTMLDSGSIDVPSGGDWWYPVALVALPSTGHLLLNWAHEHVSLTLMSLMTLGVPVISVVGAAILFDETLAGLQIGGVVLVLVVLAFAIVETARISPQPPADITAVEPALDNPVA